MRENSNTLLAKKRNNSGDSRGEKMKVVEALDSDRGKKGENRMWHYITERQLPCLSDCIQHN